MLEVSFSQKRTFLADNDNNFNYFLYKGVIHSTSIITYKVIVILIVLHKLLSLVLQENETKNLYTNVLFKPYPII